MSPESHPELAIKLAGTIAEIWNELAKNNGWPTNVKLEAIKRNRKTLSAVMKGLEKTGEIPHGRDQRTLLKWTLSRWNWTKSPAPLSIVGSMTQWDALTKSLAREVQEKEQTDQERLGAITKWITKEIGLRNKTKDNTNTRKEVQEFAEATGKINSWTNSEQQHFHQELERQCP